MEETKQEGTANLPTTEKRDTLKGLLREESVKKRFEEVLGKKAPGFMSSIISATQANKKLAAAEPMSIIRAAAIAAALDLPINPSLGFAHIVPYKDKNEKLAQAQFQMGWKGYVQLGMRSGQYKTINATPVCEGELIRRNKFTGEMEFDETKQTSDKKIGYVAYFRLLNGFEKWLYMTDAEVTAHGKRYSKSYESGKWTTDPEPMKLKTVIKMLLSKYGILSIEMQMALQADQAVVKEGGEYEYPDNKGDVIDAEEIETSNAKKLTDRFKDDKKDEDAPGPCPDKPDITYLKSHCDQCQKRKGCPVWA